MNNKTKTTVRFLELLNRYPSPHNGQPIVLKQIDNVTFELYFQRQRGLQSSDISYIFSFVSMGVFVQHMELCAQALGHDISFKLKLPHETELRGTGEVLFGTCILKWNITLMDKALESVLRRRKTSRKKYTEGVSVQIAERLHQIAANKSMKLEQLSAEQAHNTVWLNQRAIFDDMFDEPVQKELDHWLRYNQKQKQQTKDGLAYDCMELNGSLLKFVVHHPSFLRMPGVSNALKRYYLRTMSDASSVFYLQAPFETSEDSFKVGQVIMDLWINCTQEGYYIHPFGTIVSNHQAHRDFLKLANIDNESRNENYVVFIFRAGKSEEPHQSLRLDVNEHLLRSNND